jgi:hypothetical protein
MTTTLLDKHLSHAEVEIEDSRRAVKRAAAIARVVGAPGTAIELDQIADHLRSARDEVAACDSD